MFLSPAYAGGEACESNQKIPVYKSYLDLTNSYDLTILLNQLAFSQKDELDLYELKRFTLSDKHPKTIRKQLNALQDLGLISKRKNILYGRCIYKARADIYPNDNSLVALIEGYDLRVYPDYLSAAIINKFRTMALSGNDTLSFSINDLRRELRADKSISTIRGIILKLESNEFLTKQLVGRRYSYKLNHKKLLRIFDNELIQKQSRSLLEIFIKYLGEDIDDKRRSSWIATFRNILIEGYDDEYLKHIIAFIHKSEYHIDKIKTPSHLRYYFDDLKRESYFNLSRRKANRYIYKLINNQLDKANDKVIATDTSIDVIPKRRSEEECWELVKTLLEQVGKSLRGWYQTHSLSSSSIDYEDYVSEARLLAFKLFRENLDKETVGLNCNWLKYQLQLLMYTNKTGRSKEIIYLQPYDTIAENELVSRSFIATEDDSSFDTENYVKKILSQLDDKSRLIVEDYYGLNGETLTYIELAKKYNISNCYANKIVKKALNTLRDNKPPD